MYIYGYLPFLRKAKIDKFKCDFGEQCSSDGCVHYDGSVHYILAFATTRVNIIGIARRKTLTLANYMNNKSMGNQDPCTQFSVTASAFSQVFNLPIANMKFF